MDIHAIVLMREDGDKVVALYRGSLSEPLVILPLMDWGRLMETVRSQITYFPKEWRK